MSMLSVQWLIEIFRNSVTLSFNKGILAPESKRRVKGVWWQYSVISLSLSLSLSPVLGMDKRA